MHISYVNRHFSFEKKLFSCVRHNFAILFFYKIEG